MTILLEKNLSYKSGHFEKLTYKKIAGELNDQKRILNHPRSHQVVHKIKIPETRISLGFMLQLTIR